MARDPSLSASELPAGDDPVLPSASAAIVGVQLVSPYIRPL